MFKMNKAGVHFQNWSLSLFVIVLVALGALSCRSAKKITTALSKKDTVSKKVDSATAEDLHADSMRYIQQLYTHLQSNIIDCRTFAASLKVHYEGSDGKDYRFNALIRVQKDKMIWVSITATLLGIELFRAIITPDSVKVLNKQDKLYQLRSVSYLQEISHLPFDFNTLQSIILGNPIFLDSNIVYYKKENQGISMLSVGRVFRNYLTLNKEDFRLTHSKLDDVDPLQVRYYDITYGEYENTDSVIFSTYRKIAVAEKSKLDVELSFKNIRFNDNLEFPFHIPKNYKRN